MGTRDGKWKFLDTFNGVSPEKVFASFDKDGDGKIGYDEFIGMLKDFGINITDAKALKYFKKIDSDGSHAIDINEFRIALFALDPQSGRSSCGFSPSTLLNPTDAFEMFDKDGSGSIDEDELFFVLQYLGIKASEKELEKFFKKYDKNRDGLIDYEEFMQILLTRSNLKEELTNRGVQFNPFTSNVKLGSMLDKVLRDEEKLESEAIEEAIAWGRMQAHLNGIKEAYELARNRASRELCTALDAGGAVYLIGTGAFEEFTGEAPESVEIGGFSRQKWPTVRELWTKRIDCSNALHDHSDFTDSKSTSSCQGGMNDDNSKPHSSRQTDALSKGSRVNLVIAKSTVVLWGRRVMKVALSSSSAIVLTDLGELFVWGGHKKWWEGNDPKSFSPDCKKRGGTEIETASSTRQHVGTNKPLPSPIDSEDIEVEKFKCILEYYNLWGPLPGSNRLRCIRIEFLPKLQTDAIKFSLECRGIFPEEKNKDELLNALYEALVLEKNVMGLKFHRRIRQLEFNINAYTQRKRYAKAKSTRLDIERMWYPLREIQAEDMAKSIATAKEEANQQYYQHEMEYLAYRQRLREARSSTPSMRTPRDNSRLIEVSNLDPRENGTNTMNSGSSCSFIAAGESHMFSIHSSGELYCWGVGLSGRLGLDETVGGMPQKSIEKPTLVQALRGQLVVQVSGGRSHSAAVTVTGRLHIWGSAAHGKLGMGVCEIDSYTATPGQVPFGRLGKDLKVASVSCGAAHSAATTTNGQLFVWGCGDGGRLGLGPDHPSTVWTPTLVNNLSEVRIASVSCGTSHTIALEAIPTSHSGEMTRAVNNKELIGGRVFQAGPTSVLGVYAPTFTCILELEGLEVRQVSAGHAHSAVVTTDGELYCWGNNRGGCCGQPLVSSIYDKRTADIAVDGSQVEIGGSLRYCCTQHEPQAWWEVDLGMIAHITEVHVWNHSNDQPPMDSSLTSQLYQNRLFSSWIMIYDLPFDNNVGESSLRAACNNITTRKRITERRQFTRWIYPKFTRGRYIRVQIEGFGSLKVTQVKIMGQSAGGSLPGVGVMGGGVESVTCGMFATMALVKPWNDPHDVENAYKRAVQADSESAEVLRQLDTFVPYYDKFGRGDSLRTCTLCCGNDTCEVCLLKHTRIRELMTLPLGPGGRLRRLDSIRDFLYEIALKEGGKDESNE